jgi:hypothetical protein
MTSLLAAIDRQAIVKQSPQKDDRSIGTPNKERHGIKGHVDGRVKNIPHLNQALPVALLVHVPRSVTLPKRHVSWQ